MDSWMKFSDKPWEATKVDSERRITEEHSMGLVDLQNIISRCVYELVGTPFRTPLSAAKKTKDVEDKDGRSLKIENGNKWEHLTC